MNDLEVLEGLINNRLSYLKNEAEQGRSLQNEANFNQFWQGKLAQIEGMTGEIPFLEKLLAKISEIKEAENVAKQFG